MHILLRFAFNVIPKGVPSKITALQVNVEFFEICREIGGVRVKCLHVL